MEKRLNEIIEGVKKYIANPDVDKIRRAYDFAAEIHAGQYRFSGDPYMIHPLEATKILLQIRPDVDTICACIMHDTVEDDRTQRGKKLEAEIEKKFGKDVAKIVDGVSKLGRVRYRGKDREIESLRKMFVAMAEDVRVILVRLADRLHNMQTLDFVRAEKQERIAKETLEVYTAVAARLGLYQFKHAIEDLCFEKLYPVEYERIKNEFESEQAKVARQMKEGVKKLNKLLKKNKINGEVSGRVKNLYGIFKKMRKKGFQSVGQVNDIFALRVIVDDVEQCYAVLGLVHNTWLPVPGRFKDYIAKKKVNGYQSLHTEVIGLLEKSTEIQIRSYAMHNVAEYGVAAHWHYKEKSGNIPLREEDTRWLQGILHKHKSSDQSEEFLHSLQLNFFEDEIFVMTPNSEIKVLPEGATPVDFAYLIHTDIGHRIKNAKVDGHIVPLDYKLKNGETVEIITQKNPSPSRYWLNFVKTSSAREKIKAWLASQDSEKYIRLGAEMVNEALEKTGYPKLDANLTILRKVDSKRLSVAERKYLLESVGNGSVTPASLVKRIYPEAVFKTKKKNKPEEKVKKKITNVIVGGEPGLEVRFASCCKPKYPGPIFAYITRNESISIHRRNCSIRHTLNPEQKMPAHWEGQEIDQKNYRAEVRLDYKPGLLGDILHNLYKIGVEILSVQSHHEEEGSSLWVDFTAHGQEDVDDVKAFFDSLSLVKNISIFRLE